jgi:glc operon protein GlcG
MQIASPSVSGAPWEEIPPIATPDRRVLAEPLISRSGALASPALHHFANPNMKMKIAVSVCDEGGHLVAFQRMDGAFLESIALAIGKAIGAAASRKSSGDKDDVLDLQSVWRVAGAGLPVIAGRPGGLPITRNAQTVGAIGVSGSATDQEDEQCAKAGVEALDQSS